ncbi:HAAS signaling domain-containing protein [Micromonospora matsumotoense]|uniref:HAAS signaling domain-containing protein n=1 Tax=Micromonospora matsumotoense TaxID=121616 RepID=UPI0033D364BD
MTVTGQEITDYVERVRAALADLPPQARDELTEDLPEHLTEVAAEADGSLVDRLGTPEAYAAELRAAAGAGDPAAGRRALERRIAAVLGRTRARVGRVDARLGPLVGHATAGEFLRLLRPAWWVARAYLAAMLVTAISTDGPLGLLPRLDGNEFVGLLMFAGLLVGSIWLGRRTPELRTWRRWAVHAGAVVLALFAVGAVANVDDQARYGYDYGYESTSVQNPYDQVQDVYVYDSEGRLVENARLFDQNGTPIRLGWPACDDPALPDVNPVQRSYPYCPQQAPFRPRPPAVPPLPPGSTGATGEPGVSPAPTATGAVPTATAPATPTPTAPGTPVPTAPGRSVPTAPPGTPTVPDTSVPAAPAPAAPAAPPAVSGPDGSAVPTTTG